MFVTLINRWYCFLGILLFLVFTVPNSQRVEYVEMHLVNCLACLLYGTILYKSAKQQASFYTKRNLCFIVLPSSIVISALLKILSYSINNDLYVFSKSDAIRYHLLSLKLATMSLPEIIDKVLSILGFDDLGAFLWISSIFRMVPSLLFLNLSYCVVGTITALMLFNIGRFFMPRRYAFMASLAFSISSYIITMHTLCLKETIMIFFIIASFYSFYFHMHTKKIRYIISMIVCVFLVFMFRTPTALLLIFSFGLTYILLYTKGLAVLILGTVMMIIIGSTSIYSYTYERYLRGGDTEEILNRKNELAKGGGLINQLADPIAALTGPFPSVRITDLKSTPLYSSGLLYRLLLCGPFFIGGILAVKKRYVKIYPPLLFFLTNAIGVSISVKGLEARLSMPHLAMMYVVAFWFLAKYDYNLLLRRVPEKWINGYFLGVFCLCILWNLR